MRGHRDYNVTGNPKKPNTMHATRITSLYKKSQRHKICLGAFLVLGIFLSLEAPSVCEAKEFDWSELGMSLAKSSPVQNNLRILVSPQRRMTKGYDYEYVNSNQTSASGSQTDSSSYAVVPSSSGGTYLSSASAHSSPSSAYSALSASLASLKSRLSSRGVSLGSTMSDNGSSSLYSPSSGSTYGSSSLAMDQSQGQQSSQHASQEPSTYLSMSASQQDPQVASTGQYTMPPSSQANDNKTIVLAIPAKINFLTEGRSSKQQSYQQQQPSYQQQASQQQQAQQVTMIQSPSADQRPDPYAAAKQQMDTPDQSRAQMAVGEPSQEHSGAGQQHYVIVNQSPSTYQSNDPHSHQVAANLSPASSPSSAQMGQMYSPAAYSAAGTAASGYPQQQQQQQPQPQPQQQAAQPAAMIGSYAMKYAPTYQAAQAVAAAIHQPTIQKIYNQLLEQSVGASQAAAAATGVSYELAPQQNGVAAESSVAPYDSASMSNRYMSCLDTCNSADPRWRKYTVSKYKACCSRSSLFDANYDQPSADRVGDLGAKYSEDAYYNYLYRRSRSRRSRRQRQNRYSKQQLAPISDEDADNLDEAPPKYGGNSGRGQVYSNSESPYVKYYKTRASSESMGDGPSAGTGETGSGKYGKERSYKQRGRAQRDMDGPVDSPASGGDMYDEDAPGGYASSGRGSSNGGGSSYSGSGDYSLADSGRYSQESGRQPAQAGDDEEVRPVYDDAADSDKGYSLDSADYPMDSAPGSDAGRSGDDHDQPEEAGKPAPAPAPKRQRKMYNSGGKSRAMRERKIAAEKESKSYSRKGRKGAYTKYSKPEPIYQTNNQTGSNDYEPAQSSPVDPPAQQQQQQQRQNQHESSSSSGNEEEPQQAYGGGQRDSSSDSAGGSNDNEREPVTKYKQTINDTAVANLSKTTMHLKEILSLLEKKALLSRNETAPSSSSSYQTAPSATSTPAPTTTTTASSSIYSHSYLGGVPLSLSASNDYITTAEFGSLKSPYRLEVPSLSASSLSSSSLPSSFAGLSSDSTFGSSFGQSSHNSFGLLPSASSSSSKQLALHNVPHTRKRRVPKTPRYSPHMVYQKSHAGFGHPSSMMMSASSSIKNPILSPAYYSTLQYTPYVFGRGAPGALAAAATSSYPYKTLHKTQLYSSALHHGPSKLGQSAGLYSDADGSTRLHSLSSYDPLANVASVLRPSTAMRLRNKPFIFHSPHHLYARQPFLTQSVEAKKA